MIIQSLTLQNFRNIGKEQTFLFNRHFTVVIGVNGKGKSTLLHGLRIACGCFMLGLPRNEVKTRNIQPEDIHLEDSKKYQEVSILERRYPVRVEATGQTSGLLTPITWKRLWHENHAKASTNSADYHAIVELAKTFHQQVSSGNQHWPIPVFAYFGAGRSNDVKPNNKPKSRPTLGKIIFQDAYQDWDDMKVSRFQYRNWFELFDILVKENKEYPETNFAFMEAIQTANPYITELGFARGELFIKVAIGEYKTELMPLSLHSDGVRFYTEMVAELAYRCIILNGAHGKHAVLNATGVVMIDELDLHLHPKWQKHVVSDLKKAFPQIQFIVTTHSPFIVQSLKSDELIVLEDHYLKDGDPYKKGIEDVAEEEMGVNNVARSNAFLEMMEAAEKYYALIKVGKNSKSDQETATLRATLNQLEERFSNDPAFVAALKLERRANQS